MRNRLRILQLSPRFPLPADDGGKIGIFNITKQFAEQDCDVTFFTFDDGSFADADVRQLEEYARFVSIPHKPANTIKNALNAFVRNDSLYLYKHFDSRIASFLEKLLKDRQFDVVHADHTAMARAALYVRKKTGCVAGLRLHNVEWIIWKRFADTLSAIDPRKYYSLYQALLLRHFEGGLIEKFDIAFPITPADERNAKQIAPKAHLVTVPAGVETSEFDAHAKRIPKEMIIATSFLWKHNTDGLWWFVEHVMPEIRKRFDSAQLTVLGKASDKHFHSDVSRGIRVLGYVTSAKEHLQSASICIAPLFVGGGIRIKILEALSLGLPTVATSVAAEGIGADESTGLFRADSEQEFVARISYLMSNPPDLDDVRRRAAHFIRENYSWHSGVETMIRGYSSICKSRNT